MHPTSLDFPPRVIRNIVIRALCFFLMLSGTVYAQERLGDGTMPVEGQTEREGPYSVDPQSGSAVLWLPTGELYAPYAADLHRVGFGFQLIHFTRSQIANAGKDRNEVKVGGRFGVVRGQQSDQAGREWQVSFEIGLNAQFDEANSLDNIGWDGKYGLMFTSALGRDLSYKVALSHDSSHLGDEYVERTGRLRIGYTRHELSAGVSWLLSGTWRTYAEAGRGFLLSNEELQKPGRFQLGLEWQDAGYLRNGRRGWYGALDLSSMQERDWRIDRSLQTGYRLDSDGRAYRFGIQWYSGRPPIGEFFQNTESFLGVGIWVDI
jgi:hypothetical protein